MRTFAYTITAMRDKVKMIMLAFARITGISGGTVMSRPSTKLLNVANYFISKSNEIQKPITNKKLQKLVYYAQAWSLVLNNGEKMFDDQIEAWVHGPAIRSLYGVYKDFGYQPIKVTAVMPQFSKSDSDVLAEVWRAYGPYDADYLETLTHSERPWQNARGEAADGEASTAIIDLQTMKEYYASLLHESQTA